ncbi:hypothetical protein CUU66_08775 [Peribacillus deserti]|uniref:Uncharacterized protein n=1 Tax=Peribacillus deserti TaxID=673318 RepID=A0A2N5M6Z8_9BACI|nr:hypothetical protein CUU66_08775 [Peribacillus deserti]
MKMNLVNRLATIHTDKTIISLNSNICPCLTMNRIDPPHFLWFLESIEQGRPVHSIKVDKETAEEAILALHRMIAIG